MTDTTINITIDASSVAMITNAGQNLAIMQTSKGSVSSPVQNESQITTRNVGSNVIWASIPAAQNLTVAWSNSYEIYQGPAPILGHAIQAQSITSGAAPDLIYAFDGTSIGQPTASAALNPSKYYLQNASASLAASSFGLAQTCMVNGSPLNNGKNGISPIRNDYVLAGQIAQFLPVSSVAVFLNSATESGVPIDLGPITISPFTIPVSGTLNLNFNPTNSTFYQS